MPQIVEAVEWSPAVIILGIFGVVALALTAVAIWEAIRAQAWGWLVGMVILWPVGVIAWFVAGRRLYLDTDDEGYGAVQRDA